MSVLKKFSDVEILKDSFIQKEFSPTLFENNRLLLKYKNLSKCETIGDARKIWDLLINSLPKSIFLCSLLLHTIDACIKKEYHSFDAHTTSNCCHGMAVLARDLILSTLQLDLNEQKEFFEQKIKELEENLIDHHKFIQLIPEQLLVLSSLFLLAFIRDFNSHKVRTDVKRLKSIHPIGTTFCTDIHQNLKRHFSNVVAHGYRLHLQEVHPMAEINGAPINLFSSYVEEGSLRRDNKGGFYAPCIYSNQVALAYLSASQAKVVLVCDIINSEGKFVDRYTRLLQGNGHSQLVPLSQEEINLLSDHHEPVVVYEGYVVSDTTNVDSLAKALEPWLDRFPNLMLACDIFYPQFPKVKDDPSFDSTPIYPKEAQLMELFIEHANISGVSVSDPSLYCASHIYPASLKQVLDAMNGNIDALPQCFSNLQIPDTEVWGMNLKSFAEAGGHFGASSK